MESMSKALSVLRTFCVKSASAARGFILVLTLVAIPANLWAQSTVSITSSTKDEDKEKTHLAVPGGAGATVTSTGTAGAGPLIGFQVWKLDKYFASSFFSFSPPLTVSGQQREFGTFLLNPSGRGTSYAFIGNKMWGFYPAGQCANAKSNCTVSNAHAFYGIGIRGGITNTTWQTESESEVQSVDGTVAYVAPEFVVTSKTYNQSEGNQYQFGLGVGPSFRFIAGDLAQAQNDDFRKRVLGTDQKSKAGVEITFFVRMNEFKPYVRFSHFSPPNSVDVPGFSGSQFVFGVDVLSPIFKTTLGP